MTTTLTMPTMNESDERLITLRRDLPVIQQLVTDLDVCDPESAQEMGELLRNIKTAEVAVHDYWDEDVQKAHELHKSLTSKRKQFLDVLSEANRLGCRKLSDYERAEQEKAETERRRLQAIVDAAAAKEAEAARVAAENARLEEAARLESAGHAEAARELIEQPVHVTPVMAAPVHVESAAPKIDGVSGYDDWCHEIVDASLIPREYLVPSENLIRAHGKAMKQNAKIPGVKFYPVRRQRRKGY